jgi:oligopeptidase A
MRTASASRFLAITAAVLSAPGCAEQSDLNPFFTELNEPIQYAEVTAEDVTAYADLTTEWTADELATIESVEDISFETVIRPFDYISNELNKAQSNSWMLYWVSPDSATRVAGFDAFQKLDSVRTSLMSRRSLYDRVVAVQQSAEVSGVKAKLVDDLMGRMRQTGVELSPDDLARFKELRVEINELTRQFSVNMNTDIPVLEVSEEEAAGLPDGIRSANANDDGGYSIPVMPITSPPVMGNATVEETRQRFFMANTNRGAEENLPVLDQLMEKRHELGVLMGGESFADFSLRRRMAKDPGTVWAFLEDLIARTEEKARADLSELQWLQVELTGAAAPSAIQPWNTGYLRNTLLKTRYGVDAEEIREYLPVDKALSGMMDLYQELLGLEFRQVEDPSVWHEEVTEYHVFDGDQLVGRFYLDLYPRPNKEGWFYGVPLTPGSLGPDGYEVPVSMLLGNFTRATDDRPALVSHNELSTLFHEFGHIMAGMSYRGEFAQQAGSMADFSEAMSQIFENWIWDYDVLSTLSQHYETGEVLPRELFDNMLAAKNMNSGLGAQGGLRLAVYDMMMYNRYDPTAPHDTDELWTQIADRFVFAPQVEGTHRQASWIHINTHPTYYYGYIWSAVYSADMFTLFKENGLRDPETGRRYRDLILANGTQRPIPEVVEEFLGRPMNSEAYIESLGLGRN